ncbi:MAG: hypothetical protein FJW30_19595 [Acidobacteria bacterium]|nr:hypothetical protein [Acidobacteriota bacterium]
MPPHPIEVLNPQNFPGAAKRRVTLVRFTRAVTGPTDPSAPDFDFRGFVNDHGPVLGMAGNVAAAAAQQFRVQLMRDRIEAAAQLFVSVDDAALVRVMHPAAGQPLNPRTEGLWQGDCIYLVANSDGAGDPRTKLKVHFGSAGGPVIAEMGLVVYAPREIFVQGHRVTINGPAHALTPVAAECAFLDDQFTELVGGINAIYSQAGVRFTLRPNILTETVNNFTERGTVTLTGESEFRNTELQTILRCNPEPESLNMYIFNQYRDVSRAAGQDLGTAGIACNRDNARENPPEGAFPGCQAGITLRKFFDAQQMANIAAHEIGHSLRLIHYASRQRDDVIYEIYASRNLMLNTYDLPNNDAQTDIGYDAYLSGASQTGTQLGIKAIATARNLRQSQQIRTLRRAVNRDSYKPLP